MYVLRLFIMGGQNKEMLKNYLNVVHSHHIIAVLWAGARQTYNSGPLWQPQLCNSDHHHILSSTANSAHQSYGRFLPGNQLCFIEEGYTCFAQPISQKCKNSTLTPLVQDTSSVLLLIVQTSMLIY